MKRVARTEAAGPKRQAITEEMVKLSKDLYGPANEYEACFAPDSYGASNNRKYSDFEIAHCLRQCGGFRSKTARALKVDYATLWERIKMSPYLIAAEKEINESRVDYSELQLFKNIRYGDMQAIRYHLNYKGKSRGYGVEETGSTAKDKLAELARMIMDGSRKQDTEEEDVA